MKKLLLVLGLVAMFSLAASAKTKPITYNFQFLTVNGDPYCDGMYLNNYGNPQVLVDGFHSDPYCVVELGFSIAPVGVNGFVTTVASNYQYGGGSGNVMVVSDPAIGIEECDIPLILPQPNHSTSDVLCRASSGLFPGTVYLINPVTNTWTLWVSGGLSGEYVVNWGTIQPAVGPQVKAPKLSNPTPSFAR